jgi:uncharacterized repeat protein (TIGR02543 family)
MLSAGVYILGGELNFSHVTIVGNTISSNTGGVGIWLNGANLTLKNSIVWGNSADGITHINSATATVTHSDIQGGWEGEGNIDTDPLFENGYHLSDYSPAIGTGTSTGAPNTDLEGTQRPNPTASNPDMGAYENLLGTPQQELAFTVTKTGEGEISSADNTINCGATCQADYEVDSTITLTATPATGSTFTGWSGDCSGTSTTTTVTMDTVKTCTATFELIPIVSVKLVAITSPSPVCKGEEFEVTFQVVTEESQPVDGIQVYLNFDPDKMQINSIANSGVLDFTLMEEFDNAAGYMHVAAGSWENEPPTGNFEFVTINFTALEESEETLLQVDPNQSSSTFGGKYIPQEADDTPVAIEDCSQLGCKVALEGRASPPDASWVTELKIYADGNTYTINTDNEGHCQFPKELSEGDYSLCVKNSHTLANRIAPVAVNSDGMIDFGSLLEGDVNDDNKVVMIDYTLLFQSKGKCQGAIGYNANANLNADNCVNKDDASLLQANYFKPKGDEEPSICEWNNSVPPTLVRKKVRDGGGTVTLRTAPIPSGLIAGT